MFIGTELELIQHTVRKRNLLRSVTECLIQSVILPLAVPPASHLPERLNATIAILRSVAGLFKPMKTIQALKMTTHNETATKGALRMISTILTKF